MMMKRLMAAVLLGCMLLAGCGGDMGGTYIKLSMTQATEQMAKEEAYLIVDVRTVSEYADGHIPGAICIPNEEIGKEEPAQLPDKDMPLFVYCRSGNRSKDAAVKLAKMGYTHVYEMGGINKYTGELATGETP